MLKIIMYTKKQKKSSEGVFSKFLVNLYACCLFPASFQYTSSTFLNPTQLVAIVSLPLFYLLSLKSIYAFHFPHQNVELCFCFSLLVIVKVAATFTLVFEARGSRLSETFRGPKAKKQPLWDLEATLPAYLFLQMPSMAHFPGNMAPQNTSQCYSSN